MEFFRQNQKTIILFLTIMFLIWTVGMMIIPILMSK